MPASSGRCRIGELFDPALGRSRCAPLLEALPAEDRPALGWLKGNSGFLAATRTIRPGLYFGVITCGGCRTHGRRPLRLTRFATFGLVLELLVVEEKLFTGCKNEIAATVDALEDLILKFHGGVAPSAPVPGDRLGALAATTHTSFIPRVTANLSLRHNPGFGPPCPTHGHIIPYCSIALMKVPKTFPGKERHRAAFGGGPAVCISPALFELSCGCACEPALLLRASFRPA